jgi:hypothetical protein
MWRPVDLVWTNVSEECIISIFRVEKSTSEEREQQQVVYIHIHTHAWEILDSYLQRNGREDQWEMQNWNIYFGISCQDMDSCSSRELQCLKTPQTFPAAICVGTNTGACILTNAVHRSFPQNLLLNWRVFLVLKINFHPCFLFSKLEYFSTPFPLREELQLEQ